MWFSQDRTRLARQAVTAEDARAWQALTPEFYQGLVILETAEEPVKLDKFGVLIGLFALRGLSGRQLMSCAMLRRWRLGWHRAGAGLFPDADAN
ncbi:MAG: hypothetical protein RMI91_00845 [Gemmatales bacterium]|nr:hypothetical protein [Gemmatales bacterium]MDW7993180.1 hypothetical protein [Gemmatales bacterium]